MRLGILADIHEAVEPLREALQTLHRERVDQIVTLGDFCAMGLRLAATVSLLREAGVVGVWGNHDYGLCGHLDPNDRARYDPSLLSWCETLRATLELGDCRFSHIEHWLDANCLEHLWYFTDQPDSPERAARSFRAVPHRVLFMGHLHRWLAVTPDAVLPWNGEGPLRLSPGRYLVVVHALVQGHFAVYDTETQILTPYRTTAT
jgi:predicted phosphodiesterase